MNITNFIKYLNKQKDWNIQGEYYSHIDAWRKWWQGYYESFHKISEVGLDGTCYSRDMFRLKMAKKICEDWASLLLNEKTTVSISDDVASKWLVGSNEQQDGGLLEQIDFWSNANSLVELAFRSGTGAFIMSIENMSVNEGTVVKSPDAKICIDYVPAECILPLTVRHGRVIDVAFASEVISEGKSCIYLQTHRLKSENGISQYVITNEYFKSENEDSENASYKPANLPSNTVKSFSTGSSVPWFSLFSPAIVKNIRGGNGLGMSIFSEAIDPIKQCDLAFDNYSRDILLGAKKVFYNKRLLKSVITESGEIRYIPPDSIRQQLFIQSDDGSDPDEKSEWHEYNPDLRVEANSKAVQDALDYTSFKVGLGTHHYQFTSSGVKTATEYSGDRQDMVQHINKHQIKIKAALLQIFRSILWAGKQIIGLPIDENVSVTVNFDDSYIIDAETRRQQDKDDALNGFIPKYKYNMIHRAMSEQEAKSAVSEAQVETSSLPQLSFSGGE